MKRFVLGALLFSAMPAVADMQTDIMSDRLDRLDREMTLLQKQVYSTSQPVKESAGATGNLNELYTQLEEQNKSIEDLTKRLEELTHAQDLLQEKLDRLQADTDLRFKERDALKTVKSEPIDNTSKKLSDQEAYDQAYQLLVKTKYVEAEQALRSFLKDYPDSKLVGNANYWLGETYYVRGQYDVAVGIFSDGLTKYETSAKAPDNLLKLGITMGQLNKKDEACAFLKLLPEKFPKAEDALKKRAQQEAKKLQCQ